MFYRLSDGYIPSRSDHSPCGTFSAARRKVDCGDASSRGEILASLLQATGQTALLTDPDLRIIRGGRFTVPNWFPFLTRFLQIRPGRMGGDIAQEKLMVCPVLNIDEIKDDSQARVNNYVVDFKDRFLGDVKIPGYPYTSVPIRQALEASPRRWENTRTWSCARWVYGSGNPRMKREGAIK